MKAVRRSEVIEVEEDVGQDQELLAQALAEGRGVLHRLPRDRYYALFQEAPGLLGWEHMLPAFAGVLAYGDTVSVAYEHVRAVELCRDLAVQPEGDSMVVDEWFADRVVDTDMGPRTPWFISDNGTPPSADELQDSPGGGPDLESGIGAGGD